MDIVSGIIDLALVFMKTDSPEWKILLLVKNCFDCCSSQGFPYLTELHLSLGRDHRTFIH